MNKPRRVVVVDVRDADESRAADLRASRGLIAFWRWLRRDFILRRLSLLASAAGLVFVFAYLLLHVIMLAPLLLLSILAFLYGVSGRRTGAP